MATSSTPAHFISSPDSAENDDDTWSLLFDRFNRTVRSEADALYKHIADSQTNLINERNRLRQEIQSLRKEKEELSQIRKQYDQIITLNVGGQMFSSTLDTLTKEPCLFKKMFSGRHDLPEHQGAVFVDRDPTHFRTLLNYLRTNTFVEPKSVEAHAELLLEAEYYQVASLIKHLRYETEVTTIVEKLFFDLILHHPSVVISFDKLQAIYKGSCAKFIHARVNNGVWHNGRHYWEVIFEATKGCFASMGVATSSWNARKRLGSDAHSWTLRLCDGKTDLMYSGVRHNDRSAPYYNQFPWGTRIGILLDLDEGTLEYVIDGYRKGVAFNNLKARTVTPVFEFCHDTVYRMNHNALAPIN